MRRAKIRRKHVQQKISCFSPEEDPKAKLQVYSQGIEEKWEGKSVGIFLCLRDIGLEREQKKEPEFAA